VGFLISGVSLLAGVAMILNAWHSDRSGERYLHVGIPFVFITAGYLFGGLSSYAWVGPWLAVPALAGATIGYNASMGPQWAIPPKFMKMEHAAAGIAALNTVGILGGFVGPWWLGVAKDLTGNYERGLLTMTVPSLAAFAIMLVMRQQAAKG
jgi:ACS family tartrate transporter-like MFS transporter